MRGYMVSELRLAAQYANQVARAIVRMDDRLSNFLMPCDLPTIPLRSTGRSRSTYWAPLDYGIAQVFAKIVVTFNNYATYHNAMNNIKVISVN